MKSAALVCLVLVCAASAPAAPGTSPRVGVIAYAHQGPEDRLAIWLVVGDGSWLTNKPRLAKGLSFDPRWSSDGRRLLFTRSSGTYVAEIDETSGFIPTFLPPTRITRFVADSGLDWSPDGTTLLLTKGVRRSLCTDLFTMRANGSHVRRLTASAACEKHPAWSPDGRELAFEKEGRATTEIVVSNIRGGNARTIGLGTYPAWAPDGRSVAFLSERAIVVVDVSTGAERRTLRPETPYDDVENGITWAPDGTRLAYGFHDPEEGQPLTHLASIAVDGSNVLRLTLASAYEDVDPDWQPLCTTYGTEYDNRMLGTDGADIMCGLRGDDRIRAGEGDDIVYGGDGADTLVGGLGVDWLFGAAGNDRIFARDGVSDVIDGGPGVDRAWVDQNDRVSGVEVVDRGGS